MGDWRYDPWRDLSFRHPGVHVQKVDLGPAWGAWVPSQQVILIGRHLSRAEARYSLAHEVAHIDLNHQVCTGPDGGRLGGRCERDADLLAAERLLPLDLLLEVAAWTSSAGEAAVELVVPESLVRLRIKKMRDPIEVAAMDAATAWTRETA